MTLTRKIETVVANLAPIALQHLLGCSVYLFAIGASVAQEIDAIDCDSAAISSILTAAAHSSPLDARASWSQANQLQLNTTKDIHAVVLYYSNDGQLSLTVGQPVVGFDRALVLSQAAAEHATSPQTEILFQLPILTPAELASLLSGQLVVAELDSRQQLIRATGVQTPAMLDQLYSAAASLTDLGVSATAQHSQFKLWAPTAKAVRLCLYRDGDSKAEKVIPLQRDHQTGAWQTQQRGDQRGRYYSYLVDVFVPNLGVVRNRVTDPYSLSLSTDSQRSYIANLAGAELKPTGWDSSPRPAPPTSSTELSIYELHVRDFSLNDHSVSASQRGKYLAFTAPHSNGMRHLRKLAQAGLTDIHLLPVFDFATVPEAGCVTPLVTGSASSNSQQAAVKASQARDCYNWGYDPFHYTAPEGSYASNSKDGATRIRELRQLVQALHANGLRVGMDVVYNHTSASGQAANSVLDRIVPGYYQRLNRNGEVETSTCCANTATEHRMMAKLMIDSAVVWARDYHIDSFRFDLMGHQPRAAMEALQRAVNTASGRYIPLIGEGWNFGEVANGARFVQASQLSLNGSGIGSFSDRARDAVRGGGPADSGIDQLLRQGFVNGLFYAPNAVSQGKHSKTDLLRAGDLLRVGLAGSLRDYRLHTYDNQQLPLAAIDYAGQPAGYVSEPTEVVNYVENHDNQTLFDLNVFKLPLDTTPEDRARVQILAAATVAFSQGIAYFHAGQDILRSKSMDRNSFDSGDWFNRIDWTYQDNYFGTGLPPKPDNGSSWPWLESLLGNAALKPRPSDIAWSRDAFRDLLRLRASSSLFRLPNAIEINQRLQFLNTGPNQQATVIIGKLDGSNWPGANFRALMYAINVDVTAHTVTLPTLQGQAWQLHPLHRSDAAADRRPLQESRFDTRTGQLTVPARTALVYVLE